MTLRTALDNVMEYAQKRRAEYAELASLAVKRGQEAKKLFAECHELAYFDVMKEIERQNAALLAAPEEGEGLALQRLRDAWNKLRESNFHDSEAYENMQEAVQAMQPAAPTPRQSEPHRCFSDGYFIDGKPHCQICGELIDNAAPRQSEPAPKLNDELILGESLLRKLAESWIDTGLRGIGLATDKYVTQHKEVIQGIYEHCGKSLLEYLDYNAIHSIPETQPSEPEGLREALAGLMKLIDNGELVRDTSHDHESTYALRAINFVVKLKAAQTALAAPSTTEKGQAEFYKLMGSWKNEADNDRAALGTTEKK